MRVYSPQVNRKREYKKRKCKINVKKFIKINFAVDNIKKINYNIISVDIEKFSK